jgi:hypothetical protein
MRISFRNFLFALLTVVAASSPAVPAQNAGGSKTRFYYCSAFAGFCKEIDGNPWWRSIVFEAKPSKSIQEEWARWVSQQVPQSCHPDSGCDSYTTLQSAEKHWKGDMWEGMHVNPKGYHDSSSFIPSAAVKKQQ